MVLARVVYKKRSERFLPLNGLLRFKDPLKLL